MIELYVLGGLLLAIAAAVGYAKIQISKANAADARYAQANDRANATESVNNQIKKTEASVRKAWEVQAEQHKVAQARIDAHGQRSDFESDSF